MAQSYAILTETIRAEQAQVRRSQARLPTSPAIEAAIVAERARLAEQRRLAAEAAERRERRVAAVAEATQRIARATSGVAEAGSSQRLHSTREIIHQGNERGASSLPSQAPQDHSASSRRSLEGPEQQRRQRRQRHSSEADAVRRRRLAEADHAVQEELHQRAQLAHVTASLAKLAGSACARRRI